MGSTTTTYLVDDSGIIQALKQGNETLIFMYDSTGRREGFIWYTGTTKNGAYYYLYNAQSDVIGILASDLTPVVFYEYDSWGKPVNTSGTQAGTVGNLNPFRYRGYCYDAETGFYYLNSRYYDPEVGRFLTVDEGISGVGGNIRGYNMFVYCFNNPVNMSDSSGEWPFFVMVAAFVAIADVAIEESVKATRSSKGTSKSSKDAPSSLALVNNVSKVHVTTPEVMLDGGVLVGKIGFSTTTTKQNTEPGLFHSYSDIGNDASKYGVGINVREWLGAGIGISSEYNAYVEAQVTPWVHAEVSLGFDGIGGVIGFDVGDTAYDFEIKGGLGLIMIFAVPQSMGSGQLAPLPAR